MSSGRILFVEDDETYRYSVGRTLEHAGYDVIPFVDYHGALKLLEGPESIDLLLTDIRLPSQSPHGISLAHMARSRRPSLPILFITAFADYVDEVPTGLGETLLKPLDNAHFLETVERLVAGAKTARGF